MKRRIFRSFLLATSALTLSATAAHADPISASIVAVASWVGITTTTAAVTTALISTAIATGLSYVAQLIAGKPQGPQFGITSQVQVGGVVPRTIPFGKTMPTASHAYPARTWGKSGKTPNAYFTQVIALADVPIKSLKAIFIDDKRCDYSTATPSQAWGYSIPQFQREGKDHLWVRFYDGTQTTADSWLLSQFGTDPDYPYTSNMVFRGIPYVIVTALINEELFSNLPVPRFEIEGASFYDPREDSSVGGSGSQRWNNSATWTYTENPIVVAYNVLRGISWGGEWLYGLQNTAPGRLPLDNWFAGMNACDELVDTNAGGTEPAYRAGGEIVVNVPTADFLEELFKSCNTRIAEVGGYFKIRVGAAAAAVMSITDDDIIITEQQSFDQFPGLQETVNGITAKYYEPSENWSQKDAPPRYSSTYEASDGGRRLVSDVEYNFAPYAEQVQRLMFSALREARNMRKHTIIAPPQFWLMEPLDCLSWTSNRNGYVNKLFTAIPVDQENVDQSLALQEVDPDDYDWDADADFETFTIVPVTAQSVPAQAIDGFSASGVVIYGDDERAKAGVRMVWTTAEIEDVNGVQYQVKTASGSILVLAGQTDHFGLGVVETSENLLPLTNYEARGRLRPASDRPTLWSDWVAFTTPDVRVTIPELSDEAKYLLDFIGPGFDAVMRKVRLISQSLAEAGSVANVTTQELRRTVRVTNNNLSASVDERLIAAVGPNSAIAGRVTDIEATLGPGVSPTATVTEALLAQAGANTATAIIANEAKASLGPDFSPAATVSSAMVALTNSLGATADIVEEVEAIFNDATASARIRFYAASTISGADATVGISASRTDGGSATSASLFINAHSDNTSSVWVVADKFVVTDGVDSAALNSAFVVQGGSLYVNKIVADTIETQHLKVNAATLRDRFTGSISSSTTGQFIIDDSIDIIGDTPVEVTISMRALNGATAKIFTFAISITVDTDAGSDTRTYRREMDLDGSINNDDCSIFLGITPPGSTTGTCTVSIQGFTNVSGSGTMQAIAYPTQVLR